MNPFVILIVGLVIMSVLIQLVPQKRALIIIVDAIFLLAFILAVAYPGACETPQNTPLKTNKIEEGADETG